MFPPKLQSRTKSLTFHLSNPLFTYSTSSTQELQPQLEQPITNTPYWTKRIHNLCTLNPNVDEAIHLINTLHLPLNPLILTSLIHALCHSHRYPEAHHRFLSSLSPGNHHLIPDERTCNLIIARLLGPGTNRNGPNRSRNNNPLATLRVLDRLIAVKPNFVPSVMNFNRLIDRFCSVSDVESVRIGHMLLFRMKGMGQFPNVVSYTTLIKGYCQIGELGLARKVFDEMSEWGIKANPVTYSVLVGGVVRKRGGEDDGLRFLGKLWESMVDEDDVLVNHAAFSNVIYSLCQGGLFKAVFDIAEMWPQGENVNDGFAYAQMIDSLCRYGRHHGASRIVYMMMKRGRTPSFVSYNSIVHGLAKNGGYLRAYQLVEQGIEFGYTPTEPTYKILIEHLCFEEPDLVKAKKLLDIMLNKKGVEKARIYNIYLQALSKIKNDVSTELLNTLVTMLETKCHPDVVTLNTVINGFCKMGKVEDGVKVLDDMIKGKFKSCAPDTVTFTTIISGLLTIGRTNEARDIFNKLMREKGVQFHPNVVTYNVFLRGLFKLNLADEAMDMFNSMSGANVTADSTTHAIMVAGLCERGRVDDAKALWDDVIWASKAHDNFVYSAIVKGLCGCGRFDEACDFVYELVDCGIRLNVVNYNVLIEGACRLGLKKEAYQIVAEMRKNGVVPDAVTWRIIDKLHKQKKV